MSRLEDRGYMELALCHADRARGRTFPNPAVGAVVVRNHEVVAAGATQPCGKEHAEKSALKRAGALAHNATMYVTLEPCCHHGRTPPCTDAIIKAGISRVVVACKDPNPVVAGKGLAALRNAGVRVEIGLLRSRALALNEDYFWSIIRGKSWISVKLAMTLDGRLADIHGDSQWITSEQSRTFVHDLRRRHAAVAVGRKTLLADNPRLDVRHVKGSSPARFVFSSVAGFPDDLHFVQTAGKIRSICVCAGCVAGSKSVLRSGVEVWHTGGGSMRQRLDIFRRMAFEEGLISIFIEGGQRLVSSFMTNRLVNRLYLFYGNKILGSGRTGIDFKSDAGIDRCVKLDAISYRRFGEDFMVTGIPRWTS